MAWIVKRGSRFYVRWSQAGRRFWFSVGKSRRVAELAKAKLELRIAENRVLDREERSTWTLQRLAEVYLQRTARLQPKSAAWRSDRVGQILTVLGGETRIEDITPGTVDAYVDRRLAANKAVSTVTGEVFQLRKMLKAARRWQSETKLSAYRLDDWTPPKDDHARAAVFLSEKEVRRLLRAARQVGRTSETARQGEMAIRLALASGARVGEIAALRWTDLRGRTIRLATLKGGIDRSVEIDAPLALELRGLRPAGAKPNDSILPGAPGPPKERYRETWEAARAAAKLSHVRFHDLRHSFASEFMRRGGNLRDLQRLLGHRTARMTERYAHFSKTFRAPKGLTWGDSTAGATRGAVRDRSGRSGK